MCVAEFTNQVECSSNTVRRKTPQNTNGQPPIANNRKPDAVIGTQ